MKKIDVEVTLTKIDYPFTNSLHYHDIRCAENKNGKKIE